MRLTIIILLLTIYTTLTFACESDSVKISFVLNNIERKGKGKLVIYYNGKKYISKSNLNSYFKIPHNIPDSAEVYIKFRWSIYKFKWPNERYTNIRNNRYGVSFFIRNKELENEEGIKLKMKNKGILYGRTYGMTSYEGWLRSLLFK